MRTYDCQPVCSHSSSLWVACHSFPLFSLLLHLVYCSSCSLCAFNGVAFRLPKPSGRIHRPRPVWPAGPALPRLVRSAGSAPTGPIRRPSSRLIRFSGPASAGPVLRSCPVLSGPQGAFCLGPAPSGPILRSCFVRSGLPVVPPRPRQPSPMPFSKIRTLRTWRGLPSQRLPLNAPILPLPREVAANGAQHFTFFLFFAGLWGTSNQVRKSNRPHRASCATTAKTQARQATDRRAQKTCSKQLGQSPRKNCKNDLDDQT